ncbi:hypothetical protein [Nocardia sp. NPDC020380]|uniref:hypothetical protein n=1 Tax=Nocardia sp. NPDC020380 TaxID=3364309 RepID=UPI00379666EB
MAATAPATAIGSALPPRVVVPAHPRPGVAGADARIEIELARLDAGLALIAYTTVAKLINQRGRFQPWIELPGQTLAQLPGALPVLLDPVDGVVDVVWTAERLQALQEVSR